jgi:hypothetical protein
MHKELPGRKKKEISYLDIWAEIHQAPFLLHQKKAKI